MFSVRWSVLRAMALCSMRNLTIGVLVNPNEEFVNLQNNIITGVYGRHYDNFLVNRDQR